MSLLPGLSVIRFRETSKAVLGGHPEIHLIQDPLLELVDVNKLPCMPRLSMDVRKNRFEGHEYEVSFAEARLEYGLSPFYTKHEVPLKGRQSPGELVVDETTKELYVWVVWLFLPLECR